MTPYTFDNECLDDDDNWDLDHRDDGKHTTSNEDFFVLVDLLDLSF